MLDKTFSRSVFALLFCAVFAACGQEAPSTAPAAAQPQAADTTAAPAPAATQAVPQEAAPTGNPIDKALFLGKWRSKDDPKSEMEFKASQYTAIYDGKVVEEGTWDAPAECSGCPVPAKKGCFFLKKGEEYTCCIVVFQKQNLLNYFVTGTSNKMQNFERVK